MKEDTKVLIVIICIVVGLTPLFVYMGMDFYDQSKEINYYQNAIMTHLKTESCADLNASRTIYDPAYKGDLLSSESMVDQAWKEKCT